MTSATPTAPHRATRRRLLIIAPPLPPVALAQSVALLKKVRGLAQTVDITVIAASDPGGAFPMSADAELATFLPANIEVIRVPWPSGRLLGTLWLGAQVILTQSGIADLIDRVWARRVWRYLNQHPGVADVDGLVTTSSPVISHLIGHWLTQRRPAIPWVQHYSDPFVDLVYRRYSRFSRWFDLRWERRFLEEADGISVTSAETADMLTRRYARTIPDLSQRLIVTPHVYDRELFTAAGAKHASPSPFASDRLNVAYLGHFYGPRSVMPVCRWLDWRKARGYPAIRVLLFGSLRQREADMVRARYADAIELHEPITYLQSLSTMQRADALLVVDAPTSGPSIHFPSKLADYLGAARPIIAFTPSQGATARIVRETGHLAVPITPDDADYETVEQFLQHPTLHPSPAAYANGPAHYRAILGALGFPVDGPLESESTS